MKSRDKYRGCLIGGAIGDALGYSVEFDSYEEIINKYGVNGISAYELVEGKALISDDTQMTLFTATGILTGTTRARTRSIRTDYSVYIWYSYIDWYRTQVYAYPLGFEFRYSWLSSVQEMFRRRAPGNTCLKALRDGIQGSVDKPINNSKGCGGVMRVAPLGLYFREDKYYEKDSDALGERVAALTHGHPLGYIPAAALVHIIRKIVHDDMDIKEAIYDMMHSIIRMYSNNIYLNDFIKIMDKAITLASNPSITDIEAITQIGQGWVAEETLAIAVYCCLRYPNDFKQAIIASVNHSGDSDSTGSVTGNIMGAYLGLDKIPQEYITNLELKDLIIEVADDLYDDCKMTEYDSYKDDVWMSKYMYNEAVNNMMIDSKSYYNLYLEDKNEEELYEIVKGLKIEITKLKKIVNGNCDYSKEIILPSPETRLQLSYEYLDEARNAIKELAGEYKPEKDEIQDIVFNENIPFIKTIELNRNICLSGIYRYVVHMDDTVTVQKIPFVGINEKYELCTKEVLIEDLRSLHIGEWDKNYDISKKGCIVCDGEQWELVFNYTDGSKYCITGENDYPYNFERFLETLTVEMFD